MLRPMDITFWSESHMEWVVENTIGFWADCSEMVTAICKWSGLHDPCGNHYSGIGNTDSMYRNPLMQHYEDPKDADIGAIVIFGGYPGTHHVAQVHTPDHKTGNPDLFTHGQEIDPRILSFHALRDYFHVYTFCSITHL